MAVAVYSSDLTTINLATGTWFEPTGATAGGGPASDTDYFIINAACMSKTFNTVLIGGMATDYASNISITSGSAVFMWLYFGAPNAIELRANNGYAAIIGNTSVLDTCADYRIWPVIGRDTYTYGGWRCVAVDPTITTGTTVYGSPSGAWRVFGSLVDGYVAVSKGNPMGNGGIRWGKTLQIVSGDASGYGTFAGAATKNDANDGTAGYNRWGLFQAVDGGYLQKGLFLMGTAGTAVDFRDSNKNITIDNSLFVSAAFNTFEVRNASSRVDWTGIQISSLCTVSPGNFVATNNADLNFDTCTFNDMNTFIFQSASTILSSTFRRCSQITAGGANFSGSTVTGYTGASDTSALVWTPATDPDGLLDNMVFIKGTTSTHAIEFGTSSPTTLTLNNITFTGYNASNGQTDSAVYIKRTTGAVIIEYSGTIPSYKSDGATVTLSNPKTLTITVKDESNVVVAGAQVYIQKSSSETGEYGHPANPYTSHASSNARGDGDFVITQTIESDNPATGWINVKDNTNKTEQAYRYASMTSPTFTFPTAVTGTDNGTGTSTTINETGIGAKNIVEGDTIHNSSSPYQWAMVLSVSTNSVTTTALSASGSWSGLTYAVHTLSQAYVSTDTACVPLMNEETNGSGVATESYNLGASMAVDIRVRLSTGTTKYFPYKTTDTISGNLSITAVLIEDTIIG